MSRFTRSFPLQLLTDEVIECNPWFGDLLRYWRPAGDALNPDRSAARASVSRSQEAGEDCKRLRLAIRNCCLNFYRSGQSVARVSFDSKGRLQGSIHNKYVDGQAGNKEHYLRVTSAGVFNREKNSANAYRGTKDMDLWIENSNRHTGKEKKFLDLVVARNPNTIDLEMTLPAYLPNSTRRPRMDLVALEPVDKRWRIAFWEAKVVDNGDARCRGKADPKVVEQLNQYTQWLRHANHSELVIGAYQETCRLLVNFHDLAAKVNPDIEELGTGIRAAAASNAIPLLLDDVPRLLIDDRTANVPFRRDGHYEKLCNALGVSRVQMVKKLDGMTLGVCS